MSTYLIGMLGTVFLLLVAGCVGVIALTRSRKGRDVMSNDDRFLGKVSLWSSIIGIVLPTCIAVIVMVIVLYLTPQGRMGPKYAAEGIVALACCAGLCLTLELVGLVSGIAARSTVTGKAGMVISLVLFSLILGSIVFALTR